MRRPLRRITVLCLATIMLGLVTGIQTGAADNSPDAVRLEYCQAQADEAAQDAWAACMYTEEEKYYGFGYCDAFAYGIRNQVFDDCMSGG